MPCRPRELEIRTQQHDSGQVLDTGMGIAPDEASQLLDAFFTTKPDGTGMGLSICRLIIESHGGRIWLPPTQDLAQPCSSHCRGPMPGSRPAPRPPIR